MKTGRRFASRIAVGPGSEADQGPLPCGLRAVAGTAGRPAYIRGRRPLESLWLVIIKRGRGPLDLFVR